MRLDYSLYSHELTGLRLRIRLSNNSSLIGTSGVVVYETMKTFQIMTKSNRILTVPKDVVTIDFELDNGEQISLNGKKLKYRPEERIKRWLR